MQKDHILRTEIENRLMDRLNDIRHDFPVRRDLSSLINTEEHISCDPESLDLVMSLLDLHWINDLPGILIQIRRVLKPDGCFLAALLGGETLKELRQCLVSAELEITGGVGLRFSPLIDIKDVGSVMQRAGFALPVVDSEKIRVCYKDMITLLHDLRAMGETNALIRRSQLGLRRDTLRRAEELYRETFRDEEGHLQATFEVIFIIGWAPHESQQKPLPRGSGQTDLSEVLDA